MEHYYFIQIGNTRKFVEATFSGKTVTLRVISLFGIRQGKQITVSYNRWNQIKKQYSVKPADRLHRIAVSLTIAIEETLLT